MNEREGKGTWFAALISPVKCVQKSKGVANVDTYIFCVCIYTHTGPRGRAERRGLKRRQGDVSCRVRGELQ